MLGPRQKTSTKLSQSFFHPMRRITALLICPFVGLGLDFNATSCSSCQEAPAVGGIIIVATGGLIIVVAGAI